MVAASGDVDEGDVDVEEEGNVDEVDDGKLLFRCGVGWLAKRGGWGCDSSAPGWRGCRPHSGCCCCIHPGAVAGSGSDGDGDVGDEEDDDGTGDVDDEDGGWWSCGCSAPSWGGVHWLAGRCWWWGCDCSAPDWRDWKGLTECCCSIRPEAVAGSGGNGGGDVGDDEDNDVDEDDDEDGGWWGCGRSAPRW